MGFADALGQKNVNYYKPDQTRLKDYERYQHEDISRLRGGTPYGGTDLGFRPQVLNAQLARGSQESQAAYKSDIGNIARAESSGGGLRAGSGASYRARQRATQGRLGRDVDVRTRTMIADALQRRRDMEFRMRTTGRAYGQGTSIYNAAQAHKAAQGSKWGKLAGGVLDAGVSSYTAGMMG